MSRYGLKSAETRLLLACCGGGEIGEYARDLDWGRTLRRAEASGLAPAVYGRLKRWPRLAPEAVLGAFQARYLETAASNLRQMHRLGEVLRVLEERSIPAMLLKGAALLTLVYRDPGLRPMTDVDLLVRREQLRPAAQALYEAGLAPAAALAGREKEYARKHHHLIPCVSRDGGLAVELHHNVVPAGGRIRAGTEEMWRRAQPVKVGNAAAWAPAPSDLLLHLAIHAAGAQVFDRSLGGLHDIAQTVRCLGKSIDWTELVETAGAWNASRHAYCCLRLAENMLPSGIPDEAIERLRTLSGFRLGEHGILLRTAEFLVLRPPAERVVQFDVQEKLWDLALAPGRVWEKTTGAARIVRQALALSARVAKPDLPAAVLPFYAALVHPWVRLRRRMSAE